MGSSQTSEKERLRDALLRKRRGLEPALVKQWGDWVQKHFLGAQCYLAARRIGFYAAFDNEVDTRFAFERARADGKIPSFPRVIAKGEMVYLQERHFEEMKPNKWGIPEPDAGSEPMAIRELDLVVVPGAAFDMTGCRIGYGGGYYDRLLSQIAPQTLTVGFAYRFQVLDSLPCDEHDQRVKRIVTEQGFLKMCL